MINKDSKKCIYTWLIYINQKKKFSKFVTNTRFFFLEIIINKTYLQKFFLFLVNKLAKPLISKLLKSQLVQVSHLIKFNKRYI